MSISYFNKNSSSSGSSPFHILKRIPLLNKTNVPKFSGFNSFLGYAHLPVWRSAVANNHFQFDASLTSVGLYSTNGAGTVSTVGTSTFTSYLASSNAVSTYLSTTDQCLYVLLYESPQYLLIKVNDTSGATTALGSAFTPATAANWPDNGQFSTITDNGVGGLELYFRGFKHTINKTTGAVSSQDVAVTIGSYSLVNTIYKTLDGTIAISPFKSTGASTGAGIVEFAEIISASSGNLRAIRLHDEDITEGGASSVFSPQSGFTFVDNDKIFLGRFEGTTGGDESAFGYVYRADFDKLLKSIVDWAIGA